MTTTQPKPDELPLDEAIYLYCCGYFGRKLGGEFKERIRQIVNESTPTKTAAMNEKEELVVWLLTAASEFHCCFTGDCDHQNVKDCVKLLLEGFNSRTPSPTNKAPTCECRVKERKE